MRLGVTKTEKGFQFAFASAKEGGCSLLLYRKGKEQPEKIVEMQRKLGDIYAAEVELKNPAAYEYVYRVGEKLLPDPYATGITGRKKFGEFVEDEALRCTFGQAAYDWEDDRHPEIPFTDSIIYCTHLRGYTMDKSSRVRARGTFKGMMEKIPYLTELGITQLELMPVYEFDEYPKPKNRTGIYEHKMPTEDRKLNYWGYSSDAFYFAPKSTYAAGKDAAAELKDLVKALHKAGIELILEFYFAEEASPNLIMECLRYWVEEFHIDGIHINRSSLDMKLLTLDPMFKSTKIFTEHFEAPELVEESRDVKRKHLAEYNDGFQIVGRRLLKGDEDMIRPFCESVKKNPEFTGVVNYMANHNGFTMMDMVSYDAKHNEANGENNQDGTNYNYSWNCGFEGPSKKKGTMQLRMQQLCNAFAFVFFSQGIPLIYGGDEFGNSQQGNNNVYGQDNELSWVQWNRSRNGQQLLDYVKKLIQFRKDHDVFREVKEPSQSDYKSTGMPDISYHGESAWYGDFAAYCRQIGMMYGEAYAQKEENPIYVAYNMHWVDHRFGLPYLSKGKKWKLIFCSSEEEQFTPEGVEIPEQRVLSLPGRTICVLEGMPNE